MLILVFISVNFIFQLFCGLHKFIYLFCYFCDFFPFVTFDRDWAEGREGLALGELALV